jgi:hypothetical protein
LEVYGILSKNCRTDKMMSMGYNTFGIIREVTKTYAVYRKTGLGEIFRPKYWPENIQTKTLA